MGWLSQPYNEKVAGSVRDLVDRFLKLRVGQVKHGVLHQRSNLCRAAPGLQALLAPRRELREK
jgi:hypothetical protein